ncbi:MAG: extracellular solute-binding protein [Bacillota bacterium]|nr:extracellular solute-binding protein [Bacillota bacterium]
MLSITLLSSSCVNNIKPSDYVDFNEEKQKTELRFISSWGGIDPQAEPLNMVFNEFMENNKGIDIINESVSGEDFLTKIKVDFASGFDPDVFGLWPGSDINALINAGKVADLTDVLSQDPEWKESFKPDAWADTTYNGLIYGLPFERIFEGLFINKDLFDQYKIKIPKDFEELKKAVLAFRAHDKIPIALNYSSEGTFLYQNILASLAGKYIIQNPISGGSVKDCYIKAMEYMKELYTIDAFPTQEMVNGMDNKTRDNMFIKKDAAMIVQGSWFIGKIDHDVDTVDIIPFPTINDGVAKSPSLVYGLGCGTFYMSKNAWNDKEKRKAAIKLLKALTSQKSAQLFALKSGMISTINIDRAGLNYNYLTQKGLQLIDNAKELIGPPDSYVDRTAWEEKIVKQFIYVLNGKREASSVWNDYLYDLRMRNLIE